MSESSPAEVELLLFAVGTEVYGADATQVVKVDRAAPDAYLAPELGSVEKGARALVVRSQSGQAQVRVDRVLGMRQATVENLRRLPPLARPVPYAIGVWLDGARTVLLLDLVELVETKKRETSNAPGSTR